MNTSSDGDPFMRLAGGVLVQAVRDAERGDLDAFDWLRSPGAALFFEALDISLDRVQDYLKKLEVNLV